VSKRNTLIWDQRDNLIYCRIAKVFTFIFHSCLARKLPPTERRKKGERGGGGGEAGGRGGGFHSRNVERDVRSSQQPDLQPRTNQHLPAKETAQESWEFLGGILPILIGNAPRNPNF
jgi:hypothetical protein